MGASALSLHLESRSPCFCPRSSHISRQSFVLRISDAAALGLITLEQEVSPRLAWTSAGSLMHEIPSVEWRWRARPFSIPGSLSLAWTQGPGPLRPVPPVCLHSCSAGWTRLFTLVAAWPLGSSPAANVPWKLISVASAAPSLFPRRVCCPQLSATLWASHLCSWTVSAF